MCVCVCVCVRERERERDQVHFCDSSKKRKKGKTLNLLQHGQTRIATLPETPLFMTTMVLVITVHESKQHGQIVQIASTLITLSKSTRGTTISPSKPLLIKCAYGIKRNISGQRNITPIKKIYIQHQIELQ